ncbi:hypothetical protein Nmel_018064 [Mimus melanotis]
MAAAASAARARRGGRNGNGTGTGGERRGAAAEGRPLNLGGRGRRRLGGAERAPGPGPAPPPGGGEGGLGRPPPSPSSPFGPAGAAGAACGKGPGSGREGPRGHRTPPEFCPVPCHPSLPHRCTLPALVTLVGGAGGTVRARWTSLTPSVRGQAPGKRSPRPPGRTRVLGQRVLLNPPRGRRGRGGLCCPAPLTPGAEVVTHHVPGGIPVDEGCPRELSAKAKTRELFQKTPSRKLGSSSPTAEPPLRPVLPGGRREHTFPPRLGIMSF